MWYHAQREFKKIPDQILRAVYDCGAISFVFHQKSHDTTKISIINSKKEKSGKK